MNDLIDNQESEKISFRIGNINANAIEGMLDKETSVKQKFLSECIGTFLLVFIACGSAVYTDFEITPAVLAGGLIVTALVYAFQKISGAHFNPVVSLPMFILRKITLKELFYYSGAQLLGAMLGSLSVVLCRKGKFDLLASTKIGKQLTDLNENKEIDAWCYISALFCEIFLTFILLLVVLGSTVQKNNYNNLTGIIIGLTLICLIYTGFNISGSSMNPVRSLAPAFFEAVIGGDSTAIIQIWIYIVGPFMGSGFATLVFLQINN